MIGLLDLPVELVEEILKRVVERFGTGPSLPRLEVKDTKEELAALSSLSRTCKVFHSHLTARVYCYMTKEDGPSHDAFLSTIRSSKPLAKLVKCYYTPRNMHRSGLWKKIMTTIPRMRNLKALAFRYNPLLPPTNLFPVMPKEGPMPFQLHYLLMEHINLQHNDAACDFVITQQELKHLLWPLNDSINRQVAARFPNKLITLEAPIYPIIALLPGRSIQNLNFMTNSLIFPPLPLPPPQGSTEYFMRPIFPRMGFIFTRKEFLSLRTLSFTTFGFKGDSVIEGFTFVPSLAPHSRPGLSYRLLEKITTDSTNIELIHTLLASGMFPKIKHVKMAWNTNEPDGFNRVQERVLDIFMVHRKIRSFVIFGKDNNDPQYCREWMRDNEDSRVELL